MPRSSTDAVPTAADIDRMIREQQVLWAPQPYVVGGMPPLVYAVDTQAAVPEQRPPTDAEIRTQQLQARGVRVLRDDEVIDRGGYVVWKDYDPSWCVITLPPREVVELLPDLSAANQQTREARLGLKYISHATKPLRVESGPRYSADQGAFKLYVDEDGAQKRARFFGHTYSASNVRSTIGSDDSIPINIASQPSDVRGGYMRWLLREVRQRGIGNPPLGHHSMLIDSLFSPPMMPIAEYRGQRLTAREFECARDQLAYLGQLIANADETTSDEIIDALAGLPDSVSYNVKNRVVAAWNARACGDDLVVADCGHVCDPYETNDTHDGPVCNECFEDYVYVEDSDDYRRVDEVYEHPDGNYYTYEYEDEDDDWEEDEDEDEDDDRANRFINSYSTNVLRYCSTDHNIVVSPYGEFLMGVELEVAPLHNYRYQAAQHTRDNFCEGYAILKNDGSLGSHGKFADGFEIVTAPRGLAEHIRHFKDWEPHPQLRAWDAGRCGMHVHISSGAFSSATLGKFIEFINAKGNTKLIEAIAGRTPETDANASDYCQREGHLHIGNPKKTIEGKSLSRYYMVNTTNLDEDEAHRLGLSEDHAQKGINTIELRIFRATLNKNRLLAQLEFAHAAVMFCRWSSMRELTHQHFMTWLRDFAGTYPHLAKWMGVQANKKEVNPAPAVREFAEV